MSSIAIRRLHLATRRDRHWPARIALERALADVPLAQDRLVLVRRVPAVSLDLSTSGAFAEARREAVLREQFTSHLEPMVARAKHGSHDRAGSEEVVWFRDREEALACFIALLAKGQRPRGWFWQAALPKRFEGLDANGIAEHLASDVLSGGVAAIVAKGMVLEASRRTPLSVVVKLLAGTAASKLSAMFHPVEAPKQGAARTALTAARRAPSANGTTQATAPPLALAMAQWPEFVACLEQNHLEPGNPVQRFALALLAIVVRPDLASSQQILQATVEVWETELARSRTPTSEQVDANYEPEVLGNRLADPSRMGAKQSKGRSKPKGHETKSTKLESDQIRDPAPAPQPTEANPVVVGENPSRFSGAGLMLVIPALIRLGYPEWLSIRPDLVRQDAARQLILHCFACHAPEGLQEATELLTGSRDQPLTPPTPSLAAACHMWRKALNGWLKRKARCRLHDLAAIHGWQHTSIERQIVAFPLSAIHMGLRRHALDVDPGWVPWLGLSLRYAFCEHPYRAGSLS